MSPEFDADLLIDLENQDFNHNGSSSSDGTSNVPKNRTIQKQGNENAGLTRETAAKSREANIDLCQIVEQEVLHYQHKSRIDPFVGIIDSGDQPKPQKDPNFSGYDVLLCCSSSNGLEMLNRKFTPELR